MVRYRELLDSGIAESFADDPPDASRREPRGRAGELDRAALIQLATANTYIAIEHLVLAAASMGIGTCWVGAADGRQVRAAFDLPRNIFVVALVAVGYPAEEPRPRPRLQMEDILLRPLP
jgi:nitroreductase